MTDREKAAEAVDKAKWMPQNERAAFPQLYFAVVPDLLPIARDLGYALMVHGSVSRDLDLLAVPWVDDAADPEALVEAIRAKFDAWVGGADTGHACAEKPHGRLAWTIMIGGHANIDLSVMPRAALKAAQEGPDDE